MQGWVDATRALVDWNFIYVTDCYLLHGGPESGGRRFCGRGACISERSHEAGSRRGAATAKRGFRRRSTHIELR
jgi:hypothetical protein